MKTINAAMLGLGSVHQNLLRILIDKRERLADEYGLAINIVAISDSSGIAVNLNGFDPRAIIAHKTCGSRVDSFDGYRGSDQAAVISELSIDLIFEATPVDFETGGEALEIARAALSRGVSVVLANKGPVVHACNELRKLAQQNNCGFKYSATVCGGLPILNIGERDMIAGEITEISGVFNGTSNFIIDAMKNGVSFDEAVKEAQAVGAAEADPSLDTEGWDTAFKMLIIANSIMDADITLKDMSVEGITNITAKMIQAEEACGNTIKLIASAKDGEFAVKPTVVPKDSYLGSIDGWEMGVEIHTDIYGISYHKLYEKEPIPTAASMMRDAVNIFI